MSQAVITVERLTKTYRVYARPWDRLRELLSRRSGHRAFSALEDVSFEVARGESLGIVGENGAGKSTLLKILSDVTMPTRGRVVVRGTVASLLELGMGFHPELTGRQNIRLNAAMIGLAESEMDGKIPRIIAFSELGEFIDRPVKTYSSGMAMRLGFAIAVQVEPEILIIDEALSVGDGYFQKKCMDRLRRYLDDGGTLLFCSHAMYYVSAFCDRALWLRGGEIEALGPVDRVVRAYESFLAAKSRAADAPKSDDPASPSDGPARLRLVRTPGAPASGKSETVRSGAPWSLEIEFEAANRALQLHVAVAVNRASDGIEVCAFGTHRDGLPPFTGRRHYRARLEIPQLTLVKGSFTLYVYLLDEAGLHVWDQKILPAAFTVESSEYHFGVCTMPHSWENAEPPAAESPAMEAITA